MIVGCRLIVIWALVAGGLLSQSPAAADGDPGAMPPANCWVIQGGGFSRTGKAATTPVVEALERRWTWKPDTAGEIEGDPLVWNAVALVVVREGDAARRLVLLDLLDGAKLGDQVFRTKQPLLPSLWANFVVVRSSPNNLEALQLSGRKPRPFEFFKPAIGRRSLSGPVFLGHDVFVRADEEILRFAFRDAEKPVWTAKVPGAKGEISLRGDAVFVAADGQQGVRIVALAQKDGKPLAESPFAAGVQCTDAAWVGMIDRHAIVFGLKGFLAGAAALFERDPELPAGFLAAAPKTFPTVQGASAVPWGSGFVVPVVGPGGRAFLLGSARGEVAAPGSRKLDNKAPDESKRLQPATTVLAEADRHPDFTGRRAGLSRAGNVIATGGGLFDSRSSRILQRWEADVRPVPVRGGWLTARAGGEITMWRSAGAPALPAPGRDLAEGRALTVTGDLLKGPLKLSAAGVEIPGARKPKTVKWADILCIEEGAPGKEKVLFATSPLAVAEAKSHAAHLETASALAELAKDAAEYAPREVVASVVDAATVMGADDGPNSDLAGVRRKLRNWKPHPTDSARAAAAGTKMAGLLARPVDLVATAAKEAAASEPRIASALLKEVFARDRVHAGAYDVFTTLVPAGITVPAREATDTLPLEWLDFLESLRDAEGVVVAVPSPDRETTPAQNVFGSVRESPWGKTPAMKESLYALHVGDVALVTRSKRPRNVGRCAVAAVEVCKALERLFATEGSAGAGRQPMEVRYFPTRREFLSVTAEEIGKQAGQYGAGLSPKFAKAFEDAVNQQVKRELADVAGVYFPDLRRANFFEPDQDDPLQSVEQVFRHELTHAWLDLRNPRRRRALSVEQSKSYALSPGQWCVEGFPTFLQEQVIDPRSGELLENPSTFTLDFLAHSATFLPWTAVVSASRIREIDGKFYDAWKVDLHNAAVKAGWTELPNARLKTYLGVNVEMDPLRVFYRQAAMVCHWLYFANEGRHRAKLIDFISRHYSGEPMESLDFQTFFGLDPDEVGRQAIAYAKKKIGG